MFQSSKARTKVRALFAIYGIVIGVLAPGITGCSSTPKSILHQEATGIQFSQERPLKVQVDSQRSVAFMGYADKDDPASQAGAGVIYPGNTAGVFLASVAVHALAANAVQNSAEQTIQTEANAVLADYLDYIADIEEGEIAHEVIKRLNTEGGYPFGIEAYSDNSNQKSWVAHVQPAYIMTQDQRQIMLRATILLSKSETPDQVEYQNVIDVVSPATQAIDPKEYWLEQDELRRSAESLFYLSLSWMITDIMTGQKDAASEQATFQYTFGGENFYERGNLLAQDCNYTTTRNLRGWIRMFPASAVVECEAPK